MLVRLSRMVVAVTLLASCGEREMTTVSGTVAPSIASSATGYAYVALRLFQPGPGWFGGDVADVPMPTSWPLAFSLDESSHAEIGTYPYVVRAWLAHEELELNRTDGAPWAEADLTITCSEPKRCAPVSGIELVLIAR